MADLASRITQPDAADTPVGDYAVGNTSGRVLIESTDDVEVKLSDLADQTDNPLSSASSFEEMGLQKSIVDGLFAHNFKKPSKIQERALPLLLSDPPRNMIAQSQSGTGKTAAFVITALSRIDFSQPDVPQVLVLAPTRELALQIVKVFQQIGQFCEGLKVFAAVPKDAESDVPPSASVQATVVVGTPGTVKDMLGRGSHSRAQKLPNARKLSTRLDGSQMKLLILDEADQMLSKGFGDTCMLIKGLLPKSLQVLLFSATFGDGDGKDGGGKDGTKRMMNYAVKFAPNANQMRLRQQELTVRGISQMYMDCSSEEEKYDVLCRLYGLLTTGSSVIFVRMKRSADMIQQRMEQDGHRVTALHGDCKGTVRDERLEDFRTGKSKVLITTDVLSRGIDVPSLSMVINYDIPMKEASRYLPDPDTYLHRIGRTGRFGRVGVSISFIHDQASYNALASIAEYFGIELVKLDPKDWEETEKMIGRVIKSSRAQADYKPGPAEGASATNV